jgi:hypothetical protein
MATRICSTCKHREQNKAGQHQCTRYPPQVGFLLVPDGEGRAVVQNLSTQPIVMLDQHCGEWAQRIEIVSELPSAS